MTPLSPAGMNKTAKRLLIGAPIALAGLFVVVAIGAAAAFHD